MSVVNTLGLCARAQKIATGELVLTNIRNKKAKLVLIASNASDNTKKKMIDKCTFYGIDYLMIESSEILSKAIGQNNRMAVAIIDDGFAAKLKEKMKE